jgi:very-short-patch-repair endonuclease
MVQDTKSFIKKAKELHGDKYDYSKVIYKGSFVRIKIICPKHGLFEQAPCDHTHTNRHTGCPKCGINLISIKNSSNTEKFINKAKEIHGDKYDYSKVRYKGCSVKVKIICPKHGLFEQTPISHINQKRNCQKCSAEIRGCKKKRNTKEFIDKAVKVHGKKYDYSLVDYENCNTKIKIICPKHGIFEQSPITHLVGSGCIKCGINERTNKITFNTKKFIDKATIVHENKYNYSKVRYKGSFIKVKIICSKHGVFMQDPSSHLFGHGCRKCSREKINYNKLTNKEFIKRAKKIHRDKYDYTLTEYKGRLTKIKIICPKHGMFEQKPRSHLKDRGCLKCASETISVRHLSDTKEFIKKAKKVHGNKYDYSFVDYKGCNVKVKIICSKHGEFLGNPCAHLNGVGCPICLESRGEQKIAFVLDFNKVNYEREKSFTDCKNVKCLFFDFYIPHNNICIEYDGKQHFTPISYFGGIKAFKKTKKRDYIKNNFCLNNGIKLIRISYKNSDVEINNILKKEIIAVRPSMKV